MRKIAVVGHNRTIKPIVHTMLRYYKDLEILEVAFKNMEMKATAIEYLKANISSLDGIIFTGHRPFEIINAEMGITIPQIYVKHDQSILLQTILEAASLEDYDIRSFSCDSYGMDELMDAFAGFGMPSDELEHHMAPRNDMGDNLVWELFAFHKQKYEAGDVSFCMTGVAMVYEKLNEAEIPCLLMQLTNEAIINAVNQLFLKIGAIESSESQIVVLSIEIDLPGEFSLLHENEYQLMLEKAKVSEQIYKFAELIQAAVVEPGDKNYMLFSTRQILETVTEKLNSMPVLYTVTEHTAHTVSIGIGYGKTAREAKYNAALGLNRALSKGGNQAFTVNNGKYSDPIYPNVNEGKSKVIADPLYKTISEASGISINKIYKLHSIVEKEKKDRFTSGELAEAFGNTRRSMNRILEKLEHAGYAEIEGTRMMSENGRPTRIIRLKI